MKIKKNQLDKTGFYMALAIAVGMKSTCLRRHVGAIVVDSKQTTVLSIGYNGNARGLSNRCDYPDVKNKCGCLHSEQNAITHCHSLERNKILFAEVFPCLPCAKWILQMGFKRVYYCDRYVRPQKQFQGMNSEDRKREKEKIQEEKQVKLMFKKFKITLTKLQKKSIHKFLKSIRSYINPAKNEKINKIQLIQNIKRAA